MKGEVVTISDFVPEKIKAQSDKIKGIPSFDLLVDTTHYGEIHHKSSDTIDKVNAHDLASGTAIIAITAYALAERTEPIAPRLNHHAVSEIVRKANLEGFLKAVGAWN